MLHSPLPSLLATVFLPATSKGGVSWWCHRDKDFASCYTEGHRKEAEGLHAVTHPLIKGSTSPPRACWWRGTSSLHPGTGLPVPSLLSSVPRPHGSAVGGILKRRLSFPQKHQQTAALPKVMNRPRSGTKKERGLLNRPQENGEHGSHLIWP